MPIRPLTRLRSRGNRTALMGSGLFQAAPGVVVAGETFSRALAATYFDVNGVLQTAASGVKRDAHYISGARTLLLESLAINRLIKSQDFSDTAAWLTFGTGASITRTPSAIADPMGGFNAYQINPGTDPQAVFNNAPAVYQSLSFTGLTVTFSIWVRTVSGTSSVRIGFIRGTSFDSGEVAITTTWKRITITGTFALTGVANVSIRPNVAGNTGNILVFGAQAEQAPFASSYIQTVAAAVTRPADALSWPAVTGSGRVLHLEYYDLATGAFVDNDNSAYVSGSVITPPIDRAYTKVAVR